MKRWRRMLLLALVCLLPLAAMSESSWFDANTQGTFKASALKLAEQLETGDFDQAVVTFAPELKAQMGAPQLQAAMAQMNILAGAFQEMIGANASLQDGVAIVEVYARHQNKAIKLRLPYDQAGQLIGLWMNIAPEAEVEQLFKAGAAAAATGAHSADQAVEVGEYKLPGTLVTPREDIVGQGITVLLVAGSGPQDRDETIGTAGNKPLRDIADGLAAQGIASLRYDKRSYAAPQAFAQGVSVEAEVLEDVQAAVKLLQADPLTKDSALYVIGHSLGGMLVPQILTDNPVLQGAVILAGSPRSLWDIIYDQNIRAIAAQTDITEEQRQQGALQARDMRDQANAMNQDNMADMMGLPGSYIVSLNALRLAQLAKTLTQPLFIMQGEQDVQVYADKDFIAWQALLGEREGVEYRLYPGLNHLFMQGKTSTVEDYNDPSQVDAGVISDIADWLLQLSMED